MHVYESAEDYLEAILVIEKQRSAVRSIDIANRLGFSKPSVSIAMKNLRENGYIQMAKEGWIELTDSGREIAERIYERHRLLSEWLMRLGVPEEIAVKDACRIEHDISSETFEKLKAHIEKELG